MILEKGKMADYKKRDSEVNVVNEPDMSRTYTARDYLEWTFDGLYELIRGKVYKMSPAPSSAHQDISTNLVLMLGAIKREHHCKLYHSPFDVYLVKPGQHWKDTDIVLEPDLCIICDPGKIQKRGCVGSPDFVLEILSPSTSKRDHREKFSLYEEYGVPEYWIVDPFNKCIIRNILKDDKYEIQRAAFAEEVISPQQFPDLKIKVEDVFEGIGEFVE